MKTSNDDSKPNPTYDFGYPTPAHGKIPVFHSIEEEAEFWDTQDITELKDQLEPLFSAERLSRSEEISIPINETDRSALDRIATEKGIPSATLVRMWVEERLDQERAAS